MPLAKRPDKVVPNTGNSMACGQAIREPDVIMLRGCAVLMVAVQQVSGWPDMPGQASIVMLKQSAWLQQPPQQECFPAKQQQHYSKHPAQHNKVTTWRECQQQHDLSLYPMCCRASLVQQSQLCYTFHNISVANASGIIQVTHVMSLSQPLPLELS